MTESQTSRVALFVPSLRGGGAERVMVRLAGGFAERGLHVDLVVAQAVGPYLEELSPAVQLVDLKAKRTASALPGLTRYLREARPAALLSTLNHANVIALAARRLAGVKTRVFVREANTSMVSTKQAQHWRGRLVPVLMRMLYAQAEGVIAVSQGVADDLFKGRIISRASTHVIFNPVISPELTELSLEPVEHPWFNDGSSVVLAVGRLSQQKDYPTLLRAFQRVATSNEAARLMILGEGTERAALESLIKELEIEELVSMPGFVNNPFAYMARCDVFVLSSLFEGLPNTLIQAMAVGARVVATDCPSGPSEILEQGRWGKLIEVGDVKALAQSIEQVLADDADDVDTGGEHLRRFDLAHIADQYLRLMIPDFV